MTGSASLIPTGRRRPSRRRQRVARERELFVHGPAKPRKEVPTLTEFAPRFLDGYARANRQKPSGIAGTETVLRVHLVPCFGRRKLNGISSEDVQRLKGRLHRKAPKTVNNVFTVLNTLLKVAVEWDVMDRLPCTVRLVPTSHTVAAFHDFESYDRLVAAAKVVDDRAYLVVLLGGDSGLRCGEMMALKWTDLATSGACACSGQTGRGR